MYDIVIIGAGPAGLSSATYARRAGYSVLVLEGGAPGGQLANTPEVENYPGLDRTTGVNFGMMLFNQARGFGADIRFEGAKAVELAGDVKVIHGAKNTYEAKAVIIANGAKRRKLGCPGEKELTAKGVSYCATCDGAFFKDKPVAVVGGGNTALEDALYLANHCSKVYLIHRRDAFRGSAILAEAVLAKANIEVIWNSVARRIDGDSQVRSLEVGDVMTGEARNLTVDAVFVAIGLEPDNGMFEGQVDLDSYGYIIAGEDCKTNLAGVFAAGDTRTKALRQVVTAAADGAVSAFEAGNYIHTWQGQTQ